MPEFENTKFRQLDDVLKERDANGLFKMDEEIKYYLNRWRNHEFQKQIENEDKESRLALVRSVTTITEERERDECIIEFFNRIGKFKELPEHVIAFYDSENFENKFDSKYQIDQERYRELVEEAIDDYLNGNIPNEEIESIRAMLFTENKNDD